MTTKELIYTAADELLAEGIKPSQQLVRDKIGKGSATTIHRVLNEWWIDLGKRLQQQKEKSSGVPAPLQRALDDLWQIACKQAAVTQQQQQERLITQVKQERASLAEEKHSHAARIEKLSDQLTQAYSRIEKLQNDMEVLQEKNFQLDKELYQRTIDLENKTKENRALEHILNKKD